MILVYVPHDKVGIVWPAVAPLIEKAIIRGDLSCFAPLAQDVLAGCVQLWVATEDDGTPRAAAVTRLVSTDLHKYCVIIALGGERRGRWLGLAASIEQWARAEGCFAMRIMGRKGWAKVLPDYRIMRVVLDKEL